MAPHWKRRPRFFRKIPFYLAVGLTDQSGAGAELANRLRVLPS